MYFLKKDPRLFFILSYDRFANRALQCDPLKRIFESINHVEYGTKYSLIDIENIPDVDNECVSSLTKNLSSTSIMKVIKYNFCLSETVSEFLHNCHTIYLSRLFL